MQQFNKRFQAAALYITIISATLLSSCSQGSVTISGRFVGGDSSVAYIEEITTGSNRVVDSVALNDKGEFKFKLKNKDNQAKLYNIIYDLSIIPLFTTNGEKITINSVGNIAKNYTVSGSKESALIRTFYQAYISGIQNLDKIAILYGSESTSEQQRQELAKEYNDEYLRIKREQLHFIIENKSSLAAVYALYQRLPNDEHLFSGNSDVIYYRTVAEALEEEYPDSPYLMGIKSEIENFDAVAALTSSVVERGYPDLVINDMYGKKRSISELEGNVILVDFWSAELGNSNQYNAELKELYAKYKESGFEVYQVCIESSKSRWINTVQEQQLPWVSVCDLLGGNSTALSIYNISRIPSNFIINRAGDLVARDIYGTDLEKRIKAELSK